MSTDNKAASDPFSLAAGVPPASVEGELVPKPKVSIGMSRKVIVVMIAGGVLFLALFFASLEKMDHDKTAGDESKKEEERPSEDIAGQLPKDFQSSKVGAVNKPPEIVPMEAGETAVPLAAANKGVGGVKVPPGGGNGTPQMSPEELRTLKLRDERDSRLLQARLTGLEVKSYQEGGGAQGNAGAGNRTDSVRQRSETLINSMLTDLGGAKTSPATSGGFSGGGMPGGGGTGGDQGEKQNFINTAGGAGNNGYLEHTVMPPLSTFQLNAGAYIPAILEMAVNSDLPGQVTARVRENVYASVNENCLLVPSGAQLVGRYDSKVAIGQARQLVVWNRLFFPNGHELNLAGMSSSDVGGQAGLNADVDNHWLRLFGVTLGMSAITAGVKLSVGQPATSTSGMTAAPSAAQTVSTALTQQFGQLGGQLFGKYLNIQPTLRNYPGERFNVVVPKSIVFPRCYGR